MLKTDKFITKNQLLVAFDGSCAMCNRTVQFLAQRDRFDDLRFTSLESELGAELTKLAGDPQLDSILVLEKETILKQSDAAIAVGRVLPPPWRTLARIASYVPKKARDKLYGFIAKRRKSWFGLASGCQLSDPEIERRLVCSVAGEK